MLQRWRHVAEAEGHLSRERKRRLNIQEKSYLQLAKGTNLLYLYAMSTTYLLQKIKLNSAQMFK